MADRRSGGKVRSAALAGAIVAALGLGSPADAEAFVWPNVPERVAHALESTDPAARRGAALEIGALPFESAKPLVMKALGDEDDEVRVAAARVAVRLKLPEASDLVIGWLTDSDARVRLAACEVIRAAPTTRAVVALGRLLADPSQDVRVAAAQAMGRSSAPEAVSLLLGHLDDSAPEVRGEVALALGRLGDPRAALPLVGKVQDSSAEVRRKTARSLGMLRDKRATSALVLALGDASLDVRVEAANALGKLGNEEAVSALAPLVQVGAGRAASPASEPSLALRQAALRALGRIGSPRAIDLVVAALEGDRPEAARSPARDALLALGPRAEKALVASLSGVPSARVALGAVSVLGAVGGPAATPAVVRALQQGQVPAPVALAALGELGDERALTAVLELIADPTPEIRRAAISAASRIEQPGRPDGRAVDPVRDALANPDLELDDRVALVGLLGRTGAPRAAELLLGFTTAKNVTLRRASVRALGDLATSSEAMDLALVKALDDELGTVRMDAAVAVARVGRPALAPTLLDRLMKSAEQDRAALGVALSGVMSRADDEAVVRAAIDAVPSAPTQARDALVEGVARTAKGTPRALEELAKPNLDDRRKVAEVLAARGAAAEPALLSLARDPDAGVRANAVWSLGVVGTAAAAAPLGAALADAHVDVATNAAAALGRVAQRASDPALAAPLCDVLSDPRSYVRANAVVGLTLVGARCSEEVLPGLLGADPSERVRVAVARALRSEASPSASSVRALERCQSEETSFRVARACEVAPAAPPGARHAVTVFVAPDGAAQPVARAPFALVLADGTVRAGVADRRGAVFEVAAPDGELELTVPAALAFDRPR